MTVAKLFVSNASGKIGLVGFWDCICFDEFAGKDKKVEKSLVDIMKNYMANRSFSRGVDQMSAEASMVFMGNTKKSVAYMLKHTHFFEQLPDKYIDSAFLDRLHAFNPGWEVPVVRHELFTNGYGFIVDYIAEVLKHLRTIDFTGAYKEHFEIVSEVSTRDQTGFEKTFSGLMKILYPHGKATKEEIAELLHFSMECRRRVREHIIRIDDTFPRHDFVFKSVDGGDEITVLTPEEIQFPEFAAPKPLPSHGEAAVEVKAGPPEQPPAVSTTSEEDVGPKPGDILIAENTKGWSYRKLFADYLRGAQKIEVRDPYVRASHQIRNMMEFLKVVYDLVPDGDDIVVKLFTKSDQKTSVEQEERLNGLVDSMAGSKVSFSWELDHNPNFHNRVITTDTGWQITLERGLDIFQPHNNSDFSLQKAVQEERLNKGTYIYYKKTK